MQHQELPTQLPIELVLTSEDHYNLVGALTRHTVNAIYGRGREMIHAHPKLVMDCAALQYIDSAGLAMLVEWCVLGKTLGHEMTLVNPTTQLKALSGVSNLCTFLGL